eukprot:m.69474 g.69474  ORF g.69474 m.69474 type:complete len:69 (-) comp9968_c0_seq1:102-308(-)
MSGWPNNDVLTQSAKSCCRLPGADGLHPRAVPPLPVAVQTAGTANTATPHDMPPNPPTGTFRMLLFPM